MLNTTVRPWKWWALLACLAALVVGRPTRAKADDGTLLKVIQLKHRQAADLVPVLQALAGPGGSVVAVDSRLVVRATPQGHARIEEALRSLDLPLRPLLITVSQARALVATSGAQSDADVQRVAALEGYPALIQIGRSEPVATLGLLPTPHGRGIIVPGTSYAEAGTGFYVLARLDAHRVTLELWVDSVEAASGGALAGRSLRTTVGGSLGEWMEVGSAVREAQVRARATLGGGRQESLEERSVRVRVDEAP